MATSAGTWQLVLGGWRLAALTGPVSPLRNKPLFPAIITAARALTVCNVTPHFILGDDQVLRNGLLLLFIVSRHVFRVSLSLSLAASHSGSTLSLAAPVSPH